MQLLAKSFHNCIAQMQGTYLKNKLQLVLTDLYKCRNIHWHMMESNYTAFQQECEKKAYSFILFFLDWKNIVV